MSITGIGLAHKVWLWSARQARWFADWADPVVPPVPPPEPAYNRRARVLVAQQVGTSHTGSYKRAQAYLALIAEFPRERRRHLSLAIELALQELG
jgi:hypothetical protein